MGKKTKTSFKPGTSGNPSGRPQLPEDVRLAKIMDKVEFARRVHKFASMKRTEIEEYIAGPDANWMDEAVGNVLLQIAEHADMNRFEMVLRRYIGPVTEEINVTRLLPEVIEAPDGQAIQQLGVEREDE